MKTILSEANRHQVKNQVVALMLCKEGRDVGRLFTTENGKGGEGNLGQAEREFFEILHEVIFNLYASPAPTQSR